MMASARAPLAIDQGIEHRVMLHVGIVETSVLTGHVFAIHRQRRDRGERQMVVARQRIGDRRVVAAFDDDLVKAHVQVVIDLKVILGHEALVEQLVAFDQAALERCTRLIGQTALGGLARRQAFQHAAHLDGTGDVMALTERT
jgi:hypothetical protein